MAGYEKVIESIPATYTRRPGEWVAESGNNALLVLGTDRAKKGGPGTASDGFGGQPGAGSILAVVGRKDPAGHPDIANDTGVIYLAMKTDADAVLGSDSLPSGKGGKFPDAPAGDAATIIKSKNVRVAFEKGGSIKIFLSQEKDRYVIVNEDACEIHIKNNFVNVKDGQITVKSDSTEMIVNKDGSVKIGNLARAIAELVEYFVSPGIISQTGNLGAPVPIHPTLLQNIILWKSKYIAGNNFVKMD